MAVTESGLDWIILRPSSLTDDPGTGRISIGLANFHPEITRDDVASTAIALLDARHITRMIPEVTQGEELIASAVAALSSL